MVEIVSQHFDQWVDKLLPAQRGSASGYVIASVIIVSALFIRFAIAPVEEGLPFLTFFPAVTITAVMCGVGPGLYSLLLSVGIAGYYFLPPFQALPLHFHKDVVAASLIFVLEEVLVVLIVEATYRHRNNFLQTQELVHQLNSTKNELLITAAAFDAQDGIMITDGEGVILRVNDAFTQITGYTAAEVLGQTPRILKSGRHDAVFYTAMWDEIKRTGKWSGEIWDRRKNGEIYPKWLTITQVISPNGKDIHYVASQVDITAKKASEEKIHSLAFYDSLTQLPNRRLLLDRLHQAISYASRGGRGVSVLFIDLDDFKKINDTMGHNAGDQLLIQASERIRECVRASDTVARLGGDEFVVMLSNQNEDITETASQSKRVARSIIRALALPYKIKGQHQQTSASIGIALFNENCRNPEELLLQADIAMYQAKSDGKNSLKFFDPGMQAAILTKVSLENELKAGIEQRQFYLCYQPVISRDGVIAGVEALVRWLHPVRSHISPADFIPVAEETGDIVQLGNWILETAATQLAVWGRRADTCHLTVSVNVSVRQFKQENFVSEVIRILEQTGANPDRLKLELTESMLLSDVESTIAKMKLLKAVGITFALDDFGTGFSSLSYLSRLPLDQLKVDQSFVRNIETDESAVAICAATINLAHNLNLKVVAEGVEQPAHSYFLAAVNQCDFLQGYLYSKPLPIQEFEEFFEKTAGHVRI